MARSTVLVSRPKAKGGLYGTVDVPPSKSYTHRAVLMASLAEGGSKVENVLYSRDTNATISACRAMGARIEAKDRTLVVQGTSPRVPEDVVNAENSGTTLRFMTSVFGAARGDGYTVLTGDSSIRRRPMQPLLEALEPLGVKAWSARGNGSAPVIVKSGGLAGGRSTTIRGDVSSQFVSSLLVATPLADGKSSEIEVLVQDAVSRPYIEATLALSRRHGINISREDYRRFVIPSNQVYRPTDFSVPGDFSSASFIVAAVGMVGGEVDLNNLDSVVPQGDMAILDIAKRMGMRPGVKQSKAGLRVASDGHRLSGGRFDLGDTPDLLPVVAVMALNSENPIEIVGTAHARFKETNRIAVLAGELSKLGIKIEELPDGLRIEPPMVGELRRAELDAHDDHRMFMAFSLASMMVDSGVPIAGEESLDVSYPNFLRDLGVLGARVERSTRSGVEIEA